MGRVEVDTLGTVVVQGAVHTSMWTAPWIIGYSQYISNYIVLLPVGSPFTLG